MLDTLKPGMTKKQVYFVLGKPVIDNVFNTDLENYVYTYQRAGGEIQHQIIKIHYKADIYQSHEGTLLENNFAY
jgi:outer membrane protein assembly factor BamE